MNKKSASRRPRRQAQHHLKPVYAAVLLAFSVQTSQANPIGGSVVNGSASFATAGNTLTVTNTPGTIINWQSFSINSNEITNFAQQSASSTVLNRVTGNDPSNIMGKLQSNGRVFLINPHGILFGAGAVVDVAGLVASTLSLSDADFKAGKNHFTEVPGAGNISNAGSITAQHRGQIYLIAPNVENTGVITAPNGEILLAAGYSVDLVSTDNPNLRVNITAPAGNATNIGQLIASSGSLGLFGTVVSNSGIVSADSATQQGGKIVFKASQRVDAGGMISAHGLGGGTIDLLADKQNGTVNVTGTLDASAPVSGNGGYIDTSAAHVQVADSAHITTAAVYGKSGTWLIDPLDFTIAATGGDISGTTLSASLATGNVTYASSDGTIGGTLGDVNVNDAVSWNSANSLTLNAIHNINVNAAISNSGSGNLILRADLNGASNGGTIIFGGSGSIAMGSGRADLYYDAYNSLSGTYTPTDYSTNITGNYTAWMLVNDVIQLQAMNTNLSGDYALGTSIDASATSGWNNGAGFVQIGGYSNLAFTGQFDGLGNTISNLYIYRPTESYVGLFGYAYGGSINNVNLVDINITGLSYVGGLVGYNSDPISNSSVNVSNNSYSYVTGSSGGYYAGGLVGQNYGDISNSSANNIWVTGTYGVGGLVGYNGGTISSSNASGNVTGNTAVGGLAGYSYGTISNSYVSSGYVYGNLYVGGLVGQNTGVLTNSHYDINAVSIQDSNSYVTLGGLYDDNPSNGAVGQFSDWLTHGLSLNIANYTSLAGSGNNYTINSVQGMKDLLGFADNAAYTFTLAANIDLASVQGLYIPYLAATFNGANFTVSNLYVYQTFNDNLGLFGNIATGSTVSNVVLTNASVTGNSSVGALAGWNQGTISSSHINNSNAYGGYVSGTSNVGGLVGENTGTINSSYVDNTNAYGGSVSGTSNVGGLVGENTGTINSSYVDNTNAYGGSVYGSYDVGGLVGYNWNNTSISISSTDNSIKGNSVLTSVGGGINNSYVINAKVSGGTDVGGLVGYSSQGSISNSYVNGGTVDGTTNVGGLAGYNVGSSNTYSGTIGGVISSSWVSGGTVNGTSDVGGLVGYNTGTVDLSIVKGGTVVTGVSNVGGLVGQNGGTSQNDYRNVGTISNSYVDTGTIVNGASNVGGLVGINGGGVTTDGGNPQSSTISNSYVSGGTVTATGNNVGGLVGYNMGAINKNSHVQDSSINGVSNVGGLVGYNAGIATSSGSLVSGFITDGSYVSGGTVTGTGNNVGGLAGNNSGSISNSYASGSTITGTSNNVGGLAGSNNGTIDTSFASNNNVSGASMVGGLVGYNAGNINNTYASGGTVSASDYVGGLVGSNIGNIGTSYASVAVLSNGSYGGGFVGVNYGGQTSISNSFWNTTVAGVLPGIGFDPASYGGAVGMSDADMMTMANFNSATAANGNLNPGWDISASGSGTIWRISDGLTMPELSFFPATATAVATPNVINELVDITDQNDKRTQADVLAADTSPGDSGNPQTLPMCN